MHSQTAPVKAGKEVSGEISPHRKESTPTRGFVVRPPWGQSPPQPPKGGWSCVAVLFLNLQTGVAPFAALASPDSVYTCDFRIHTDGIHTM